MDDLDVDLHLKDKYDMVEGKGLITICTPESSANKKGEVGWTST